MANRLFICAGQSNMVGVGVGIGDLPANLQTPDENIKTWTDGAEFVTLEHAVNGNDLPGGATTTWGPEAELFRLARLDYPSDTFHMVKYAVSSTQLANSAGETWHPDKVGSYFDAVKTHIAAARAAISDIVVEGVFWFQGESDANNETRANAYEANLTAFIAAARSEWGCNEITRFIIAQIFTTDSGGFPFLSTVRAAEASVVAAEPVTLRLVDTTGDARAGDGLHLNATGNVSCGAALWAASKQVRRIRLSWP